MPTDRRHGNLVNVSLRGTKETTVDITILSKSFSKNKQRGLPPHTTDWSPLYLWITFSIQKRKLLGNLIHCKGRIAWNVDFFNLILRIFVFFLLQILLLFSFFLCCKIRPKRAVLCTWFISSKPFLLEGATQHCIWKTDTEQASHMLSPSCFRNVSAKALQYKKMCSADTDTYYTWQMFFHVTQSPLYKVDCAL